ncbi:DMT family transporter [Olivibacter domesticus]|nr:DMT family transporter [Olivibacter domesticus]
MKKSYLAMHAAIILAGFTGVFGKLIDLNEGLLAWYRVLFSAIAAYILLLITKTPSKLRMAEQFAVGKVGIFLAIHWVFFYASIKYANISIGAVCYCLTSFFTAIFEPLINRRKFSMSELLLSAITLFGISLIFHFDASYQLGIVFGVISSAFAALYTIFNERLVSKHDAKLINFYQMCTGTIGLGLLMPVYLYFFPTQRLFPSQSDFFYLLLLAIFCTVGLYILFAESLKRFSAFTVNLSFNLEPLYAILLAFLFFKEGKEMNASFYIGLLFVMSSVLLQTVISAKKRYKSLSH